MIDDAAGDDPRTRSHERSKDRAFGIAIAIGFLLVIAGVVIAMQGRIWLLIGMVLLLIGAMIGIASGLGFLYRMRARRVLATHPWREVGVTILHRPQPGKRGRLIVRTDTGVPIGITGVGDEFVNALEKRGAIEYAGDLSTAGMLFVRIPDGAYVYVATISSRADRGGN